MKVAVIVVFNDEDSIGSVVLRTREFVDNIIVVDNCSSDNTAKIAALAGAEVITTERNLGASNAFKVGFKRALELNADFVVTLFGDSSHNPEDIPELVTSLETKEADISVASGANGFQAFTHRASQSILEEMLKSKSSPDVSFEKIKKTFKTKEAPIGVQWLPNFRKYEEHIVDKIEKLNTSKDIYNEKRKVQKKLSKLESCNLICETFLKFIPPALLSLVISVTIIIPATNIVEISFEDISILIISTILVFIACWILLMVLVDKIYEKSTYIEALDKRLEQKEHRKPDKLPME